MGSKSKLTDFLQDKLINWLNGLYLLLYSSDHEILAWELEKFNSGLVYLMENLNFIPRRIRFSEKFERFPQNEIPKVITSGDIKTLGLYSLKEILTEIKPNNSLVLQGRKVKSYTKKMLLFYNDQTCVCCGKKGVVFALQIHKSKKTGEEEGSPFLTLCRYSNRGNLVPMTIDHIIPKSIGGPDKFSNYQLMCENCNKLKGSLIQTKYFTEKSWKTVEEKNLAPAILEDALHFVKEQFRLIHKTIDKEKYAKEGI